MDNARRVMDIMVSPDGYPTLAPYYSLTRVWQVVREFYSARGEGLPARDRVALVCDDEGRFEGLITFEMLLETIAPRIRRAAYSLPGGLMEEAAGFSPDAFLESGRTVREIQLPANRVALKSTDTIAKALQALLKNNLGTLPVVNAFGQVHGMVKSRDVFNNLGLASGFAKLAFSGYDWSSCGVFEP